MKIGKRSILKPVLAIVIAGAVATGGYLTRDFWLPRLWPARTADRSHSADSPPPSETPPVAAAIEQVMLSDQAIANLGLIAKPARPGTFWKTIQTPGMVVDRPGHSDRGVVAPVAGMVSEINYFAGDTVRSGDVLFTIRLLSESLHLTQTDLFKTAQDITLALAQRKRLAAASGAIPESRLIEVDNQITRLEVAAKAYRRELLTRGLTSEQVDDVAEGRFVSEIAIRVPPGHADARPLTAATGAPPTGADPSDAGPPIFEMQELKVELGQQVQAGQTLCLLANHQLLAIEGRAFPDETPLLERSVKEGWPVEVDFQGDASGLWPPLDQEFHIRYIASMIDPANRTFVFLVPLENEPRTVTDGGRTLMLWRFRPGQMVRVHVRIERLDDVFVLPAEAVTRDGADAYLFTQNVNTFDRKSVRLLTQDRRHAVVANDGALLPGAYVVQSGAAQLNRLAKGQSGGGAPAGYHVHADGSLHKNSDEER